MEEITVFSEIQTIMILLLWSMTAAWFARQHGFWRALETPFPYRISLLECITGFSFLLLIQFVLGPSLFYSGCAVFCEEIPTLDALAKDPYLRAVYNVVIICLLLGAIVAWMALSSARLRLAIWRQGGVKKIFNGLLTWFLAYPVAMLTAAFTMCVVQWFVPYEKVNQMAVNELIGLKKYPELFWVFAFLVAVVVPVIEEVIFRGVFQTWLRGIFNAKVSIFLSAVVFTLFHFAPSQGWENIEILSALFTLALFLGYLYERYDSLFAPIGLHCLFNGLSVAVILLFKSA